MATPFIIAFLEVFGGYSKFSRQTIWDILRAASLSPLLGISVITLGLFAVKQSSWSRMLILIYPVVATFSIGGFRLFLFAWYRHRLSTGHGLTNLLFAGSPQSLRLLHDRLQENLTAYGYHVLGFLNWGASERSKEISSIPFLGDISNLGDLLVHRPVHEVVIADPGTDRARIEKVVEDCNYFRVTLRIVPECLLLRPPSDLSTRMDDGPVNLPSIVLRPHAIDSDAMFIKRIFDLVVSAILLVLLLPVFFVIAVAIKLTTPKLPILYPWRVVGRNGVEFTGYKFTTMVADADEMKKDLMEFNEMSGPVFKIKNDPRITQLGKFLRKYSLNELPQIWSVFIGDMSLVGPRPAGLHELARYDFWHKRKLSVQSGITCLWQIRGRNEISDFNDWVKMDLEYIDGWSLALDLKILWGTFLAVVRGTGS